MDVFETSIKPKSGLDIIKDNLTNKLAKAKLYIKLKDRIIEAMLSDDLIIKVFGQLDIDNGKNLNPPFTNEWDIKYLYRRVAQIVHPDKSWWSTEIMQDVNSAYENNDFFKLKLLAEKIGLLINQEWVKE